MEVAEDDALAAGVGDGDLVRVVSARGRVEVPLRVTGIAPGQVFVPFHYADEAANQLTLTAIDPVSKQPTFKTAACRVEPR